MSKCSVSYFMDECTVSNGGNKENGNPAEKKGATASTSRALGEQGRRSHRIVHKNMYTLMFETDN